MLKALAHTVSLTFTVTWSGHKRLTPLREPNEAHGAHTQVFRNIHSTFQALYWGCVDHPRSHPRTHIHTSLAQQSDCYGPPPPHTHTLPRHHLALSRSHLCSVCASPPPPPKHTHHTLSHQCGQFCESPPPTPPPTHTHLALSSTHLCSVCVVMMCRFLSL